MDNVTLLKKEVRASRARTPALKLTYAQHLEVACRLVFGAKSLNHFTSSPDHYSASVPDSILEVLDRIQRCEPMLAAVPVNKDVPGYERLEQWELAAGIWAGVLQQFSAPSALLWLIQNTQEIADLPLPMFMGDDGELASLLDPSVAIEPRAQLQMIITHWLPQKEGPGRRLLIELWDQLQVTAERRGLSKEDAGYFRMICREAYNHGWSLESMTLLGVLDANPLEGSFFDRFGSGAEAMDAMKNIWRTEEPECAL
jgi:hypothetical protein